VRAAGGTRRPRRTLPQRLLGWLVGSCRWRHRVLRRAGAGQPWHAHSCGPRRVQLERKTSHACVEGQEADVGCAVILHSYAEATSTIGIGRRSDISTRQPRELVRSSRHRCSTFVDTSARANSKTALAWKVVGVLCARGAAFDSEIGGQMPNRIGAGICARLVFVGWVRTEQRTLTAGPSARRRPSLCRWNVAPLPLHPRPQRLRYRAPTALRRQRGRR